ncbi:MAG: hypothetical protein WC759_03905 [Candidatus Micrarchaeia archaeon]|jgi:hypothetical protein
MQKPLDRRVLKELLAFPAVVWIAWNYIMLSFTVAGSVWSGPSIISNTLKLFVNPAVVEFLGTYMPPFSIMLATVLLLYVGWKARMRHGFNAKQSALVGALGGFLGIAIFIIPLFLFLLLSAFSGGLQWAGKYAGTMALPMILAALAWALNGAILAGLASIAAEYKKKWA